MIDQHTTETASTEIGPETFACGLCDRRFISERARNGHESMCPANPERRESLGWTAETHGRWNDAPAGETSGTEETDR